MLPGLQVTISTAATVAIFAAAEMASTSTATTHFGGSNGVAVIGSYYNIVPPFNIADSKLLAKCAVIAQHKRQHRNAKRNFTTNSYNLQSSTQLHTAPLVQTITNDANESYLNGLPINQARQKFFLLNF